MENEIRDTIYLGVSLMMAAIVIIFLSIVNLYRGQLASARNNDMLTQQNLEAYNEFGRYDGDGTDEYLLTGSEAVALMRDYISDKSIVISVDKDIDDNYMDTYRVYMDYDGEVSTGNISSDTEVIDYMSDRISVDDYYYPFLVYNGDNIEDATDDISMNMTRRGTGNMRSVTGIVLIKRPLV